MTLLGAIRGWLTGHYDSRIWSAPFTLMDEKMARQWVAVHPDCQFCGGIIDPIGDYFVVINDSVRGVSAVHHRCRDA
jgi:hypothetical protein